MEEEEEEEEVVEEKKEEEVEGGRRRMRIIPLLFKPLYMVRLLLIETVYSLIFASIGVETAYRTGRRAHSERGPRAPTFS